MHEIISDRFTPAGIQAPAKRPHRRQIPVTLHVGKDVWTLRVMPENPFENNSNACFTLADKREILVSPDIMEEQDGLARVITMAIGISKRSRMA